MRTGYLLIFLVMFPFLGSKLAAQAPDWQVNAEGFQYSMTAVGQVYLDLAIANGEGNMLGAFVGDELRGVAHPLNIDGADYYFLTIFSNSVSGDSINFKVYLPGQDGIFDALQTLIFRKDAAVGSVPDPYHIDISSFGDFPIELLDIPMDTTLDGIPFDTVNLSNQLVTFDNDPITWTVVPGGNLTATLTSDRLVVDSGSPGWTGTDSILIIATETGTALGYADSVVAWFTILPNYTGPVFSFIPAQYAIGGSFTERNINDFLLYEGDCLQYESLVVRFEDTIATPAWVPPVPGGGAMNLVLKLSFNAMDFGDPGTLSGFVNGQLAGVATAVPVGNNVYYFLTLANITDGSIEFKFYDELYQYLFEVPSDFAFVPGGGVGSAADPVIVELAPVTIGIDTLGMWSAMIIDTTFSDDVLVEFRVYDCDFPSKSDTIQVPFLWSQCGDASWTICPGEGICITADTSLISLVWFRDGVPVFDRPVLSVFQPGVYNYQGIDASGTTVLSCPLSVNEGQACNGDFPPISYNDFSLDSLTLGQGLLISDASVELNDFDVDWTGSGGDNFWNNPDNWQFNIVPNRCQHVIIPENMHVIVAPGTSARAWRLSVRPGGILAVEDPASLKIEGN